jgi:hypothetical protein
MRHVLGKKLSSRLRKELDHISGEEQILILSCHRQFDNLKRIYKCFEEKQGDVTQTIQSHFLLSPSLSR